MTDKFERERSNNGEGQRGPSVSQTEVELVLKNCVFYFVFSARSFSGPP